MTFSAFYPFVICKEERQGHRAPFAGNLGHLASQELGCRERRKGCSVQFSSVAQSCLTLRCSTPGLPVHHQLLEFTQTHEGVLV